MLKSMTAYGRSEAVKGNTEFIAEMKSVNSRYREIFLKLPQGLQSLEDRIKSMISSVLRRGRIEVSVQTKNNGENTLRLELNRPLIKAYISIFDELKKELGTEEPIHPSLFAQLRDAILFKQDDVDMEKLWPDLKEVINEALLSLETMRVNEGKVLEKDFKARLSKIEGYINEIENQRGKTVEKYLDNLRKKIRKLIDDIEITEDRLMQEAAFLAERSDITEELVRTRSHLAQFRSYMKQDDVIGRRLEFLLQEMHREVNTIGAKAGDSFISQRTVEIKAELEKLREQVQNVE
jgi:uncharacterized protein (TIGR00255 family)